jgi:hypothetical protein
VDVQVLFHLGLAAAVIVVLSALLSRLDTLVDMRERRRRAQTVWTGKIKGPPIRRPFRFGARARPGRERINGIANCISER